MTRSLGQAPRREFLKRMGTLSAACGSPFLGNLAAIGAASAQSTSDYKALVCVFLHGGNDQSNTVVPASGAEYTAYANARLGLALPPAQLQTIAPTGYNGAPLALNAELSALKTLFDQGRCAVLANVGPLVQPVSLAQWARGTPSVAVPSQLFSHSDQANLWQTGVADRPTQTGWLGRTGDLIAPAFNSGALSICMSMAGNNVIQAGARTVQYQLTTNGAVRVQGLDSLYGSTVGAQALRTLMTQPRTGMLEKQINGIAARAIDAEVVVRNGLAGATMNTTFPSTSLGAQLRMAARMIAARSALGQRRQIFYVSAGGYDFHDNLLENQAGRLRELGDALAAFYQSTVDLGVAGNVTAFTASDFGRGLQSNGRGSDHGWGGHHFIVGGAVRGNRLYGSFPPVALNTAQDAGQGRLIPTTSVDEYAGTLAKWMGVGSADMATVLPNLGRFATPDLGFMA